MAFEVSLLTNRDASGDTWDATQLLEGRDYVVDRTLGAIKLVGSRFERGLKNYRVKYAAGYAQTQAPWVPQDLQGLCIEMANLIYRDKRNLKSESFGNTYAREYDTTAQDPYISAILGSYRRLPIF